MPTGIIKIEISLDPPPVANVNLFLNQVMLTLAQQMAAGKNQGFINHAGSIVGSWFLEKTPT